MPSDKKTPPAGPRRTGAGAQRPASPTTPRSGATDNTRSNAPLSQPPGKGPVRRDRNEPPRRTGWKNIWENVGWGLVIGLPVILVILAILWRATNGFTATSDTSAPVPTPIPTVTAGVYVAPPAASATKNRLAYLQSPALDAPQQVYTSNLDGSNPSQLTNSVQNKAGAVWSPDGKQIAFTADNAGIELVNFDGSGLHTVAYTGYNPVFSPDGKQIAFIKNLPAPDGQGPDGIGIVRVLFVTNVNAKPGDEKQLASDALGHNWSPDGKTIAFFSLRNAVMFTVDVASGTTSQIKLPNKLGGWYPTFSPDGNSFVFYGNPNPSLMVSALDLAVASANTSTVDTPLLTATAAASATTAAATTAVIARDRYNSCGYYSWFRHSHCRGHPFGGRNDIRWRGYADCNGSASPHLRRLAFTWLIRTAPTLKSCKTWNLLAVVANSALTTMWRLQLTWFQP